MEDILNVFPNDLNDSAVHKLTSFSVCINANWWLCMSPFCATTCVWCVRTRCLEEAKCGDTASDGRPACWLRWWYGRCCCS